MRRVDVGLICVNIACQPSDPLHHVKEASDTRTRQAIKKPRTVQAWPLNTFLITESSVLGDAAS